MENNLKKDGKGALIAMIASIVMFILLAVFYRWITEVAPYLKSLLQLVILLSIIGIFFFGNRAAIGYAEQTKIED